MHVHVKTYCPFQIWDLTALLEESLSLGCFVLDLAYLTTNLKMLLKENVAFLWWPPHQEAVALLCLIYAECYSMVPKNLLINKLSGKRGTVC
jgi:hypothetical protein